MPPVNVHAEPLTVEDYLATPAGMRYQLVEGDLQLMAPAPARYHQIVVLNIAELVRGFLRTHPVGEVYVSPIDVFLDDNNVVQPDVVFVSVVNRGMLADDGIHGAPDLVMEILSPSSASLERTKRRVYARCGVKEDWLVDPTLRQIHLYEFARDPAKAVRVVDDEETFEPALLPGLTISAAEVFRR